MQEAQTSRSTTKSNPPKNPIPRIDAFDARLIRFKARQLSRQAGFTTSDQADIEQEMRLKLLKQLPSFDPNLGHRRAFVVAVIERFTANILRDRVAVKRDHRRTCSLNRMVESEENGPVELSQTIGDREAGARLCLAPRSDSAQVELKADVAQVLAELPDDLRDLCERLQRDSISQVARDLGVPRTTLYGTIRELRSRFEQASMRDHL